MTYWNGTAWVAEETPPIAKPRRLARRLLGATIEAGLITALIFGLIASSAFAAKGGNASRGHGGASTATITVPDGVYGSTVTATVSPAGLWVYAECSQNRSMVYGQYVQSDANGQAVLQLGPTSWWTGGSADCIAQAGNWSARNGQWVTQGSTTFHVSGS